MTGGSRAPRALVTLLVALVAILGFVAQPAGAQYVPGQAGFILDPSVAVPGDSVAVIGTGCPRASEVEVFIDGTLAATTTANDDAAGSFETTITAPPEEGSYIVEVRCGDIVMSQVLTVSASACGFVIQGVAGGQALGFAPGFQIGTPYTVTLASPAQLVFSGVADADPLNLAFTLPGDTPAGTQFVRIEGTSLAGTPKSIDCQLDVLGGAATTGSLPRTGSEPSAIVAAGVVLVVAGGLVLLAGRRRRRHAA